MHKKPHNIVVEDINHEKYQDAESYLLSDFSLSNTHRFSYDHFNNEKEQMSPVEHRNGEKGENSQLKT